MAGLPKSVTNLWLRKRAAAQASDSGVALRPPDGSGRPWELPSSGCQVLRIGRHGGRGRPGVSGRAMPCFLPRVSEPPEADAAHELGTGSGRKVLARAQPCARAHRRRGVCGKLHRHRAGGTQPTRNQRPRSANSLRRELRSNPYFLQHPLSASKTLPPTRVSLAGCE